MDELSRRVGPSFRMLRAVSHSEWGWPKKTLKSLYHAFVSSHLSYAGAGWQPYICAKNREDLIRLQNKALRAITGQFLSTPVEALRLEAGIQSYDTHSKRLLARSWEKALRCPADHPRRATADESVDRRTTASCWRSSALDLLKPITTWAIQSPAAWILQPAPLAGIMLWPFNLSICTRNQRTFGWPRSQTHHEFRANPIVLRGHYSLHGWLSSSRDGRWWVRGVSWRLEIPRIWTL